MNCYRSSIGENILLSRSGASRKGLGVELRSSVVADKLSGLVASGGERLISRGRGVEAVRVRVGGSLRVAGCHFG